MKRERPHNDDKSVSREEFEFHLWVMLQEGILCTDKDNKYHLTDLGKKLREEGKTEEYINSYKPKYQKMLDEYEGEGFPPVDIPKDS